jgi:putative endonuclease
MLPDNMSDTGWFVYILRCADGSLYTGITKDIARRVNEHNNGKLAAAYTRSRRPVKLVYQEAFKDRSAASMREAEIKNMDREEKEEFLKHG